ncbi:hypothetical protein [Pedobacter boryungensis]|uniref:Nucleotidyltransferase n=1 Tax=Pedobacter boryungensis TaxID=869962 RepID=A0ABX2DB14_9SPHI|nr:hypothetical protein [Pedobacter boryungensis]NQX30774.1 hypothetical protein [Pedobacter boryungensis]
MPVNTKTFFPAGTAAYVRGYDGIVDSDVDYRYVPIGISLWEFGTEKNVKKKANEDYEKRTLNPEGHVPSERILIFLTPRFWQDKDKWRTEKLMEGVWKDIRAYDCRDIEEWLDETPAVSRWFAAETNVLPFDGVITVEEFWREFAHGRPGQFPPSILTGGREYELEQLSNFLAAEPDIHAVRAASKEEATAFIIACAKQFDESAQTSFISKSLVIETDTNFRSLQINSRNLNMIAKFDKLNILFPAVEKGHHVLVPLGPDDTFNQNIITLPGLDREKQVTSLISMGISDEDARRLSIEAGRDITVLRRLLKFPQSRIHWLEGNVKEIIPALLLGRWYDFKPGDRELIEMFSGESYETYHEKLKRWRDCPESPILQIGNTWRLRSPLDAWANIASFLSAGDFKNLKQAITLALRKGNPYIPKDENNPFDIISGSDRQYSTWAREGLLQSLILIGFYGNGLELDGMDDPQGWTDEVVGSLLKDADANLWISLDKELPLIAEASPSCFLHYVNISLNSSENTLLPMLTERPGMLTPSAYHTGMLWAMEALAWIPEYLEDATILLARLAKLDPGIKIVNNPINSLLEIYKSWHHQTLASLDQRIAVLRSLIEEDNDLAWKVLFSMLHTDRGTAHPTHRPRWRLFSTPVNTEVTHREYWSIGDQVIDLLLSIVANDAERIAALLNRSTVLTIKQRNKILALAEQNADNIKEGKDKVWSTLRKILSDSRSYPDADWSVPEELLSPYIDLYKRYEPVDPIEKIRWVFDDHWPNFPEGGSIRGRNGRDHHGKKVAAARMEGIRIILKNGGIEKVLMLAKEVKEPWILGEALAKVKNPIQYTDEVYPLLDGQQGEISLAQTYFKSLYFSQDVAWVDSVYRKLAESDLSIHAINRFFLSLHPTREIWRYLEDIDTEITTLYWKEVNTMLFWMEKDDIDFVLDNLEKYNRHFSAIDMAAHISEEQQLSSEKILNLLMNAVTRPTDENRNFPSYQAGVLFKLLDERRNLDDSTMIRLEYLYLSLLDGHRIHRYPKYLHAELAKNPEFFIEVIKWAYLPKNRELVDKERNDLSDEQLVHRGQQAYKLLNSMKKLPGIEDKKGINESFLKNWVEQSRALAAAADRTEVTDSFIGKLLAQYPEDGTDNWPAEVISEVIEAVGTKDMLSAFSTALFNKRGSSIRGAFAGGDIERAHAIYFEKLVKKHRLKYPKMSSIYSGLAKNYRASAKEMDDRAERDKLDY